jgi:hypothetical protein
MSDERKFVKQKIVRDTGPYMSIVGHFNAERYPGCPLADTNVELDLERFCIHWDQKEKFMDELAELITRYQL